MSIFRLLYGANIFALVLATAAITRADDAPAGTQNSFHSADIGLTLSWPDVFEKVDERSVVTREAALILRDKTRPYPTFNMIQVPGSIDPTAAAQTLLDSYHKIGLTDAALESFSFSAQGWPIVALQYHSDPATPLSSLVAEIQRGDSHAVLTFVDTPDAIVSDRALFDAIVASVQLDTNNATINVPMLETGAAQSFPPTWALLLAGVIAAALLTIRVYNRANV